MQGWFTNKTVATIVELKFGFNITDRVPIAYSATEPIRFTVAGRLANNGTTQYSEPSNAIMNYRVVRWLSKPECPKGMGLVTVNHHVFLTQSPFRVTFSWLRVRFGMTPCSFSPFLDTSCLLSPFPSINSHIPRFNLLFLFFFFSFPLCSDGEMGDTRVLVHERCPRLERCRGAG